MAAKSPLVKLYGNDPEGEKWYSPAKRIGTETHVVSGDPAPLHVMYYTFARVPSTLKTTPAVKAGVADHVWTVEEIVGLLDSN